MSVLYGDPRYMTFLLAMVNAQVVFLAWLIGLSILVLLVTRPRGRRKLRWRLLWVVAGVWLVSAGVYFKGVLLRTPFFDAVASSNVERARDLLAKRPNLVDARTLMGKTALHLAVEAGNTNMVAFLLDAGADANARGDSVTPLHSAALNGNVEIAELLLGRGAAVDATGFRHNDTPLQVAALHGNADVVRLLLANGADLNAQNMLHKTALQLAQEHQQTNVIDILTSPVLPQ